MNVVLSHLDWTPVIYGLLMCIGLFVTLLKIYLRHWRWAVLDIAVFVLVFKLHGGTMAGGFSAVVAALLTSLFAPLLFRRWA